MAERRDGFSGSNVLCAGGIGFVKFEQQRQVVFKPIRSVYTQQDVDRLVKEALAQSEAEPSVETPLPENVAVITRSRSKSREFANSVARSQRPLSKAEREQLAADLRLLSTDDDETLDLLGDRINQ